MRLRSALLPCLAALLCTAGAPAEPPAKEASPAKGAPPAKSDSAAAGLEFPANEAGARAREWFDAFNRGEGAMKKYIQANVSPASLKRRSLGDRLEVYRDMRDERGKVTALEIEEFTASRIKVIARGERAGRFSITFLCEERPPHRLMGLQLEDLPPEEGTPEGLDDAEYSAAQRRERWPEHTVTRSIMAWPDRSW